MNTSEVERRLVFPFTAIVGMEKAKLALLAVAVNPLIGGVLLRGDKGTGKTTLVRALANVLPEIEVVANCPFNCNPRNPMEMCDNCYKKWLNGEELPVVKKKMTVIDLPLSITPDRLIGTIDFEKALREGIRALKPGILAEANRNILYIDEVNLLDDYIADLILDAAAYGWNIIEREHISFKHPARFILVGSMNPEEGELRPQLLDRFGLVVNIEAPQDPETRAEIVRRVEEFSRDPVSFYKKYAGKERELTSKIARARELLQHVEIDDDLLKMLAKTLVEMKVRTCRAEIVVVRTAKAIAALDGRTRVSLEDIEKAMELALPHRLSLKPLQNTYMDKKPRLLDIKTNTEGKHGKTRDDVAGKEKNKSINQRLEQAPRDGNGDKTSSPGESSIVIPPDRNNEYRVSLGETSLWKKDRGDLNNVIGSRYKYTTIINKPLGIPISYLYPYPNPRDIDIVGTITNVLSNGIKYINEVPVDILNDLIAVRVRRNRLPVLTMIILDTSGSMNVSKRIAVAKAIAQKIIEDTYTKRTWLSLITFRSYGVDKFIPPTKNYTMVYNEIARTPTGGRTPLPAALQKIVHVAKTFKTKHKNAYIKAILITDGKANKPLVDNVEKEIKELSSIIRMEGIDMDIYDTRGNTLDPGVSYVEMIADITRGRLYRI
ncbi:VWA domain-containing protein [Desulfurococcaceae archaeon MEX13E-LK6-19]|nr:VWA domain-containing protein [Desulfurococcaceae archaeon MEX13E-LK6-19]